MTLLVFLLFICFAAAIYLILSELLHMPTIASTRAVLKLTQSKKVRGMQAVKVRLSVELAKHIHLDAYRQQRCQRDADRSCHRRFKRYSFCCCPVR